MKKIILSAIAVVTVLLLTSSFYIYSSSSKKQPVPTQGGKGFAVLELFTSEGCSSCPPADEPLKQLQKEYAQQPVYLLAYHVDYWDRQGWKDVFSNPAFSKRQRWYNSKLTSQVYTPQLVVNGNREFIGSDGLGIRSCLASILKEDMPKVDLNGQLEGNELCISYSSKDLGRNTQLVIAIVKKQAQTAVKGGENKNRLLSHIQIVQAFKTFRIEPSGQGSTKLKLPLGYNIKQWEAIGFIQDLTTGNILAASLIDK